MFLEALANGEVTFLLSTAHFLCSPPPTSLFLTTGIPTVAPPTIRPTPRPNVTPPPVGTFLLYAQGQQIGHLPLNGTRLQKDMAKTLLSLHVKWISPLGVGLCWIVRSGQGLRCGDAPGGLVGSCLQEPYTQKGGRCCRVLHLTDQGHFFQLACGVSAMWKANFRVVRILRQRWGSKGR